MQQTDEEIINNLFNEIEDIQSDSSDSKQFINKDINKVSLFDFVDNNYINLKSEEVLNFLKDTNLNEFCLEMFYHTKNLQSEEETIIKKSNKKSSRYFGDTRICYNCLQRGHTDQNCQHKINRCSLCLSTDHLKNDCPMIICMKCYRLGHKFIECLDAKRDRFLNCKRCNGLHLKRDCPDWRIFKVSKSDNIIGGKKKKKICAICINKGHLAEDCDNKYFIGVFNKHFMTLSQFKKE